MAKTAAGIRAWLSVLTLPLIASAQWSPVGVQVPDPVPAGNAPSVGVAPVRWDAAWSTFLPGEWLATGLGVSTLIASRLLPQRAGRWRGGFGFDESARDVLRLPSPSARRQARDASDILLSISQAWPFLDALVAAGWYRDSPAVGVQQALISAEVLAVTAGMQGIVSYLSARERPYGRDCAGAVLPDGRDCTARDRYHSFYSGHSSQSFAAAAVNCMHHAYVPLYGGGAADDWACVGGFGVAATTALLRVVSDVHYVSDVVVASAMGTAAGLALPWALHYRFGLERAPDGQPGAAAQARFALFPLLAPELGGLQAVVLF